MPAPAAYFDVIREMKNGFNDRLRWVTYVRQHGLERAARDFATTVPTVLRRYQAQKLDGLQELSRAPHRCPHKITGELAD
jgi:hypothetical protein